MCIRDRPAAAPSGASAQQRPRPASVAATRPRMPAPAQRPTAPLADATNREKPTGLGAAAAAAQLKHRRSILHAFKREEPTAGLGLAVPGADKENALVRPVSPAGDAIGARHSWFNGLLHRKQTQLLMSVENLTTTVETCQLLLRRLGTTLTPMSRSQATLPLTQQGPLQYLLEQLFDHAEGTVTPCKPMRFRVEYTILPVSSQTRRVSSGKVDGAASPGMPGFDPRAASRPMSPVFRAPAAASPSFATSVTFTHEKGSLTTFRMFMAKLRRDWQLDARDA